MLIYMIAGSNLNIKSADELNIEETRQKFLEKQFKKYPPFIKVKQFKQNVDADDNGGVQTIASINGLLNSNFIPRKATIKKEVERVQFDSQLKQIIRKEENNKARLPTILF